MNLDGLAISRREGGAGNLPSMVGGGGRGGGGGLIFREANIHG